MQLLIETEGDLPVGITDLDLWLKEHLGPATVSDFTVNEHPSDTPTYTLTPVFAEGDHGASNAEK